MASGCPHRPPPQLSLPLYHIYHFYHSYHSRTQQQYRIPQSPVSQPHHRIHGQTQQKPRLREVRTHDDALGAARLALRGSSGRASDALGELERGWGGIGRCQASRLGWCQGRGVLGGRGVKGDCRWWQWGLRAAETPWGKFGGSSFLRWVWWWWYLGVVMVVVVMGWGWGGGWCLFCLFGVLWLLTVVGSGLWALDQPCPLPPTLHLVVSMALVTGNCYLCICGYQYCGLYYCMDSPTVAMTATAMTTTCYDCHLPYCFD